MESGEFSEMYGLIGFQRVESDGTLVSFEIVYKNIRLLQKRFLI